MHLSEKSLFERRLEKYKETEQELAQRKYLAGTTGFSLRYFNKELVKVITKTEAYKNSWSISGDCYETMFWHDNHGWDCAFLFPDASTRSFRNTEFDFSKREQYGCVLFYHELGNL